MKEQGQGTRDKGRMLGIAVILVAAAVATAPLLMQGFSCGHDFDFHLVSWMDTLNAWRHGVFYPRWTESANYNAGEPRFTFYPPITWLLGAALGATVGWQGAPIVLTFLLLTATGLGTRALAKQYLEESAATLAGCFAIFSGYTLFCVYERSAYGELAGGCTLPLILLFMLKPGQAVDNSARSQFRSLLPGRWALLLALIIAISWLVNAPLGVMACYPLAFVAMVLAVERRSWLPVLRAGSGVTLGLALAGFYIIPAAMEQKWVNIREAIEDPGLEIENSFLFARHASPLLRDHDIELHKTSIIAVVMLGLALVAVALCLLRKGSPGERPTRLPLSLALIPLVILALQFPVSLPVWNLLPELRFLQFPWRWLVALEAPMGFFLAATIWPRGRRPRAAVATICAVAFLGVTAFAGTRFQQPCDDEDNIGAMAAAYDTHQGFVGTDEYAALRSDNSLVADNLPAGCLVSDPNETLGEGDPDNPPPDWSADQHSCKATYDFSTQSIRHRAIQGIAPQAGYLVLRLRSFPAWTVRVNGRVIAYLAYRPDGLIAVPVPAGKFIVNADWTTTPDVTLGRITSLVALLAFGCLVYLERRRHAN